MRLPEECVHSAEFPRSAPVAFLIVEARDMQRWLVQTMEGKRRDAGRSKGLTFLQEAVAYTSEPAE
jgi:hypothetical protein